jgi:hypothetical protein
VSDEQALNQEPKEDDTPADVPAVLYGEPTEGHKPEVEDADDTESDGVAEEPAQEGSEEEVVEQDAVVETRPTSITEYDWDGKDWSEITVPQKVDGEIKEIPLGELVKANQLGEASEKRLHELNELKARASQELEATQREWSARQALLDKYVDIAAREKALEHELASANLARLRDEDPAEYAVRKQELSDMRAAIDKDKRSLDGDAAEYHQATQKQMQEARDKILQSQRAVLLEKRPHLRDPAAFKAWGDEIVAYAVSEGYPEQLVRDTLDHQHLITIEKAMLYDRLQAELPAQREAVKKKLAKAPPKTMKPGAKTETKPKPKDAATILYG